MICTVDGGGVNGQAGAVRMGIARALQEFNPELRPKLKAEGFLRRDARGKERKKYGQKGARKRFQFTSGKEVASGQWIVGSSRRAIGGTGVEPAPLTHCFHSLCGSGGERIEEYQPERIFRTR